METPQLKPLAKGILGNDKLRALYEDVQGLTQSVGTKPFQLEIPGFDEKEKQGSVRIFDDLIDLTGEVSLEASARIHGAGEKLSDLYGTGGDLAAPGKTSFADFRLAIAGGGGIEGSAEQGPLKISAKGALDAGIHYRHVLPVARKDPRLQAFGDLLGGTRPPQLLELRKLIDGEVHRLDATLHLDFGLEARAGKSFAIETSLELFDGLPAKGLEASGEMALSAALGLSLYERMFLAVGRSGGMARIRLQRENERRLSFSAMMALQAQYDLGGGLAAVLEQALDQSPVPRLIDSLRTIADPVAAGDWDQIRGRLTGRLADAVSELLDDTGWKQWVAGSAEVKQLLGLSQKILELYDGVGPTVHSFWDQLLGKADLGPSSKVRGLLTELGKLDESGFELEHLIDQSGQSRQLVEMIEAFSGKSLEEILVSSNAEIRRLLGKVATQARKALELFDLDEEIVNKIREFAERTGIASSVEFLRKMPTTPQQLEAMASDRLKKLIERLAGKAWSRIRPSDLAKVKQWAQRVQALLDGAGNLEQEILDKIRSLKGEFGFSLGLEIGRVSTATALLDVDVKLSARKFVPKVERALTTAQVQALLEILGKEANQSKSGALPFQLRECVFTSRRVRTSAVSFIFNLLGTFGEELGVSRRIEESTLRVRQVGKQLRRSATYAGGFQRTESWNKTTSETALWVEFEATDTASMPSLDGKYGKESSRTLRATYAREDRQTTASELTSLRKRLEDDLGFEGGDGIADVPSTVQTRLTIDIRLPGEALSAFCAGVSSQKEWNRHYLSAARHWFHDRLADRTTSFHPTLPTGAVLDAFVTQVGEFQANWKKGVSDLTRSLAGGLQPKEFALVIQGELSPLEVTPLWKVRPQRVFRRSFDPIHAVVRKRRVGFQEIAKVATALDGAGSSMTPAGYEQATRVFAGGWKRATAFSPGWPTPTCGIWLLRSRLSEPDTRQLLRKATGSATLRWMQDGAWQGPIAWRLKARQGLRPTTVLG